MRLKSPVPLKPPVPPKSPPKSPVPLRSLVPPALCVLLFALLTWQVAAGGPLSALDVRIGHALRPYAPSPAAELGADLGNLEVALPVLAVAASWTAWRGARARARRWWLPPLTAALAMATVPALVGPLKVWLGRPGPFGPAEGYGWFPSGHAATAVVAYGAAALLLAPTPRRTMPHPPLEPKGDGTLRVPADAVDDPSAPTSRRTLARRLVAAAAVLVNLGVGAGLVLRGYHWPLDVVGSWALFGGLLWVAGPVISRRGPGPRPPRASPAPDSPDR
ncbi:phosphatase PAP2 family protein [Streptomyces pathocidini]|uniref:Phosphatase PAP2 family protein n=1 Tax=Streptomyces pathocidini TaxID=1650571 RepID=A0ABW7UNX3_9ACTN|nr:phosphatase PAP2 family protein [Streptomyces pathocidini]